MNERMKELAKQLGYNVNYKPSDDETDREYQVVSNDFAEKFAELIVKDVEKVIWQSEPQKFSIIFNVKKHFGIE